MLDVKILGDLEMDDVNTKLCVDEFYPKENLDITEIKQQENKILIRMKLTSKSCMCPKCTCISETYHGTYDRKVQDFPIVLLYVILIHIPLLLCWMAEMEVL